MSHDEFETPFGTGYVRLASEIEEINASGVPHASIFVPGEAEGAIPNGTRIEKCNTETSDSLLNGAQGTVMASHKMPPSITHEIEYVYFVAWDRFPGVPVLISDLRIRPLSPDRSQGGTPPRP